MTDDLLPGLGWLESPPDERDWGVDALYAATGAEAPAVLPAAYHVPAPLYPVVDQGSSPMCVAYSAAGEQGWYDLRDTGLALFDEGLFFRQIGGTANGALIRDALNARLAKGYPVVGHADQAASHRAPGAGAAAARRRSRSGRDRSSPRDLRVDRADVPRRRPAAPRRPNDGAGRRPRPRAAGRHAMNETPRPVPPRTDPLAAALAFAIREAVRLETERMALNPAPG